MANFIKLWPNLKANLPEAVPRVWNHNGDLCVTGCRNAARVLWKVIGCISAGQRVDGVPRCEGRPWTDPERSRVPVDLDREGFQTARMV